jgi:hypothetical protein
LEEEKEPCVVVRAMTRGKNSGEEGLVTQRQLLLVTMQLVCEVTVRW